ncbi:hypothetical protein J2W42_006343 [Rhizobium tibeticum]|uniref:hypothetical protein n=1 Tax=Rhizobium tibeticum TaxID=501024 RepID=UPI002789F948|nr:hypothetical protein [Rhizobium tibeticum]
MQNGQPNTTRIVELVDCGHSAAIAPPKLKIAIVQRFLEADAPAFAQIEVGLNMCDVVKHQSESLVPIASLRRLRVDAAEVDALAPLGGDSQSTNRDRFEMLPSRFKGAGIITILLYFYAPLAFVQKKALQERKQT